MRGRRLLARALVLVLAATAGGCTEVPAPFGRLVIATGGNGGVYFRLGNALAEAARDRWAVPVEVMETAASVVNLRHIVDGRADVAFCTVDAAKLMLAGQGPFRQPESVAALAWIYDDYLQIVVRAEDPIRTVADLRGRPVSTGADGSGTELVAERVLQAAGLHIDRDIKRRRLGATQSAVELTAGRIDGFFFTGGLPTPAIDDLAAQTGVRILSLTGELNTLLNGYDEIYSARTIAPGFYHLDEQVTTIGIPNVLVVRDDMPDETARQLTALLFDAKPRLVAAHGEARRLDPRAAALGIYPVPLHPGAAQFYRETKIMAAP